jgi:hypothetical protein
MVRSFRTVHTIGDEDTGIGKQDMHTGERVRCAIDDSGSIWYPTRTLAS